MLVIILAGAVIGSVSIAYPFGRDQGIYAYVAKLILHGKIDYLFSFNLRQPAIHYTFALGQALFGGSMLNMRIFDFLWQCVTAFVIFLITYRFSGSKLSSYASAFLYLLLYYHLDYWHTMQTEGFMNLPFALCILALTGKDRKNTTLFLAGILFSVVFLFKFIVFPFIPLLLAFALFIQRENFRARMRGFLFFLAGFALTLFIVMIYYYLNGALNKMLEIQFVEIPEYGKVGFDTVDISFIITNIFRLFTFSIYSPLILFTVAYFIFVYWGKKSGHEHDALLMWLVTAFFSLIAQWKFFYYHFLIIIPPLVIGASSLFPYLKRRYASMNSKLAMVCMSGLFIVFILLASKSYYPRFADTYSILAGKSSLEDMYIQNGTTTDSVFTIKKINAVTDFIEQNSNVTDGIFIWGIEPLIYYQSGRDCVSRFIYNTPLCWKGARPEYLKEFISELRRNNPKMILVAKRDPMYTITGYEGDSEQLLNNFQEFKKIVDENYSFLKEVQEFKIYGLTKPFKN